MADQEGAAIAFGVPALIAHQEGDRNRCKQILSDDLGALRVGGGANLINFTYSGGKVATMDIYKLVNGVNTCKRYTFTWDGDNVTSIEVTILEGD
jgi:hypothetical protein